MNHKLKYFITLLSTALFGHSTVINADTQSSVTSQNDPNDSFLSKLGASPETHATTETEVAPGGIINFSQPHYNANENGETQAKITVNRTHCTSGSPPVSVSYASSDGTAQVGSDYQAVSGRLVWGNRAKGDCLPIYFDMQVMDDAVMEGNETVNLSLSNAFGDVTIGQGNAVFTIVDDDIGGNDGSVIGFSQTEYHINEAAPFVTITVERTDCHNSSLPASVSYHTTNASGNSMGTANAGRDYIGVNGVLSWGAPENCGTRNFNVPILDNALVENDKTANLSLNDIRGAILGQNQATLTIMNDDVTSGAGVLSFSRSNYSGSENQPSATITVNRTKCGYGSPAVSVSIASHNGTAIAHHDYQPVKGTLTWLATEEGDCQPKSFQVLVKDDSVVENRETVLLQLSNPTGSAIIEQSQAKLTINDNDFKAVQVAPDSPGIFSFSAANYRVEEHNYSAWIAINRTACGIQSPPAKVTMTTSDGTATANDYDTFGAILNWGKTNIGDFNGDCEPWLVNIPIKDDAIFENSETVHLHLTNPTAAPICTSNPPAINNNADSSVSGIKFYPNMAGSSVSRDSGFYQTEGCTPSKPELGQRDAVLTIIDNDGSTIGFEKTDYTVAENRSKAIITVSRNGVGCEGNSIHLPEAFVSYATNSQKPSTAASGTDYVATQGILRWGDTNSDESCGSRQFEVLILDDPLIEGSETINLNLSRARGANNDQNKAVLTIVDDEEKPE